MNKHKLIKILVLVVAFFLFFKTTPLFAAETVIRGKVAQVDGSRVKIAYEGQYEPNVGDPVEIGFMIDSDLIPVEGRWKIVEVGPEFVWAENESAGGGEPALDYLVVITSDNPKKRTATAEPSGSVVSHRGSDNREVPAPEPPFIFEEGYDRPGGEYITHYTDVSNPQACLDLCRGNSDCVAFTWVKPNIQGPAGFCWLKGSLSRKVSLDCCVSGVVKAVREDRCEFRKTGTTSSCFCQNSLTGKWYATNPGACP